MYVYVYVYINIYVVYHDTCDDLCSTCDLAENALLYHAPQVQFQDTPFVDRIESVKNAVSVIQTC